PKLLVRVDDDYPSFSETQTAVIEAAQASNSTLDTIQIPEASHGYENHGYQETNRQLTAEAMAWVAEVVSTMEKSVIEAEGSMTGMAFDGSMLFSPIRG